MLMSGAYSGANPVVVGFERKLCDEGCTKTASRKHHLAAALAGGQLVSGNSYR